jgi:hypothetical protein
MGVLAAHRATKAELAEVPPCRGAAILLSAVIHILLEAGRGPWVLSRSCCRYPSYRNATAEYFSDGRLERVYLDPLRHAPRRGPHAFAHTLSGRTARSCDAARDRPRRTLHELGIMTGPARGILHQRRGAGTSIVTRVDCASSAVEFLRGACRRVVSRCVGAANQPPSRSPEHPRLGSGGGTLTQMQCLPGRWRVRMLTTAPQ